MNACRDCDAAWSGTVVEHCTACHLTFSGTSAGDKHRVGDHGVTVGPDRRRCLTENELLTLRIEKGAREGELRFQGRPNVFGTVLWGQSGQNPVWSKSQDESAGTESLTGAPVGGAA